jgi:hypothetical protein
MNTSQTFCSFAFGAIIILSGLANAGCVKAEITPLNVSLGDGPGQLGDVNGIWVTSCSNEGTFQDGYEISTLDLSDNTYKVTNKLFKDEVCADELGSSVEGGTFEILGPNSALSGAYDLAFTVLERSVPYEDEPSVEYGLMLLENETMYFSDDRGLNFESRPMTVNHKFGYKRK